MFRSRCPTRSKRYVFIRVYNIMHIVKVTLARKSHAVLSIFESKRVGGAGGPEEHVQKRSVTSDG